MTGKHYNWHRRWALDPAAASAEHESGWCVRYITEDQYADMPPAEIGGECWHGDQRWIVLHVGGDAALRGWLQAQADRGLRDTASINRRIARLMREAGDLWVRHLARVRLH